VPRSKLQAADLITLTGDAYVGLWRYAAEIDLLGDITAEMRPPDEPLPHLLDNPRKAVEQIVRNDFLWLRTLDTPRTLAARRYASEGTLVLEVEDLPSLIRRMETAQVAFVSQGVVPPDHARAAVVVRDPDGHALQLQD